MPLGELLPTEPWAAAVLELLPVERRGPKAYLPGAAASLGERAAAASELEAGLDAAGLAATKVDDPELARFLETEGRLVRLGDGFAVSAGATRSHGTSSRPRRPRRVRSRSRASATWRASAAATRSSCSSAWTVTGSRAGWATAGCCVGARRAHALARLRVCVSKRVTREGSMAGKADFTEEEWDQLRKGATGAGMLVSVSDRSFFDSSRRHRRSRSTSRARATTTASSSVTSPRKVAPASAWSPRPTRSRTGRSRRCTRAVATLQAKAPDELEGYRAFVLELAESVGKAAGGGDQAEAATVEKIRAALG